MFCSQDAYAPELLDHKNIQLRRLHAQAGTASRKSISKQSHLKPFFDYDFSETQSSRIAHDFERYIKETRKHKKETPQFVEGVLNKIVFLHKYNLKVTEVTFKYPLTKNFKQLLLHFIVLQCNVLYRREYYNRVYEVTVEERIVRLLLSIFNSCLGSFDIIPSTKIFEESAKAILRLLMQIKLEFDIQYKLTEDIAKKLLDKVGKLDNITALEEKCIPCPLDTHLHDPTVVDSCKSIITSDYGTDDDLKIEDDCIQIDNEEENNDSDNLSVDIKPDIDELFRACNRLQPNQDKSKVPTIYIDDDDDAMMTWEEEVKTSDKSSEREKEEKERQLVQKEKQNKAFTNHRPIILNVSSDITADIKEEVIDEDEMFTPKSTSCSDNLSVNTTKTERKRSFLNDIVLIDDDCDAIRKPVLTVDDKLAQDMVGLTPKLLANNEQLVSNTSCLPQVLVEGDSELTTVSKTIKETHCFLSEAEDVTANGKHLNAKENRDGSYNETKGEPKPVVICDDFNEISKPVLPIDDKVTKDIVCSKLQLLDNNTQLVSNTLTSFPQMAGLGDGDYELTTVKETHFLSEAEDDSTTDKDIDAKEKYDRNVELKISSDTTSPVLKNNLADNSPRNELSEDVEENNFESYYVIEALKSKISEPCELHNQTVQVQNKVEPTLQTSNNNQLARHQDVTDESGLNKNDTSKPDIEIDKIKETLNTTKNAVEDCNKNNEFAIEKVESNRGNERELIQKRTEFKEQTCDNALHFDSGQGKYSEVKNYTRLDKTTDKVILEIGQNVAVDEIEYIEENSEDIESSKSEELEETTHLDNTPKVFTIDDNLIHQVMNLNLTQQTFDTNIMTDSQPTRDITQDLEPSVNEELIDNMEKLLEVNEVSKEIPTMEKLAERPVANAKFIEVAHKEHSSDCKSEEIMSNFQKPVDDINIETPETPITDVIEAKLIEVAHKEHDSDSRSKEFMSNFQKPVDDINIETPETPITDVIEAKLIEVAHKEHDSDSRSKEFTSNFQKPADDVNIEIPETPITDVIGAKVIEVAHKEHDSDSGSEEFMSNFQKPADDVNIEISETPITDVIEAKLIEVAYKEHDSDSRSKEFTSNFQKPADDVNIEIPETPITDVIEAKLIEVAYKEHDSDSRSKEFTSNFQKPADDVNIEIPETPITDVIGAKVIEVAHKEHDSDSRSKEFTSNFQKPADDINIETPETPITDVIEAKLIEVAHKEHDSDSRSKEFMSNFQKPVDDINIETPETPITDVIEAKLIEVAHKEHDSDSRSKEFTSNFQKPADDVNIEIPETPITDVIGAKLIEVAYKEHDSDSGSEEFMSNFQKPVDDVNIETPETPITDVIEAKLIEVAYKEHDSDSRSEELMSNFQKPVDVNIETPETPITDVIEEEKLVHIETPLDKTTDCEVEVDADKEIIGSSNVKEIKCTILEGTDSTEQCNVEEIFTSLEGLPENKQLKSIATNSEESGKDINILEQPVDEIEQTSAKKIAEELVRSRICIKKCEQLCNVSKPHGEIEFIAEKVMSNSPDSKIEGEEKYIEENNEKVKDKDTDTEKYQDAKNVDLYEKNNLKDTIVSTDDCEDLNDQVSLADKPTDEEKPIEQNSTVSPVSKSQFDGVIDNIQQEENNELARKKRVAESENYEEYIQEMEINHNLSDGLPKTIEKSAEQNAASVIEKSIVEERVLELDNEEKGTNTTENSGSSIENTDSIQEQGIQNNEKERLAKSTNDADVSIDKQMEDLQKPADNTLEISDKVIFREEESFKQNIARITEDAADKLVDIIYEEKGDKITEKSNQDQDHCTENVTVDQPFQGVTLSKEADKIEKNIVRVDISLDKAILSNEEGTCKESINVINATVGQDEEESGKKLAEIAVNKDKISTFVSTDVTEKSIQQNIAFDTENAIVDERDTETVIEDKGENIAEMLVQDTIKSLPADQSLNSTTLNENIIHVSQKNIEIIDSQQDSEILENEEEICKDSEASIMTEIEEVKEKSFDTFDISVDNFSLEETDETPKSDEEQIASEILSKDMTEKSVEENLPSITVKATVGESIVEESVIKITEKTVQSNNTGSVTTDDQCPEEITLNEEVELTSEKNMDCVDGLHESDDSSNREVCRESHENKANLFEKETEKTSYDILEEVCKLNLNQEESVDIAQMGSISSERDICKGTGNLLENENASMNTSELNVININQEIISDNKGPDISVVTCKSSSNYETIEDEGLNDNKLKTSDFTSNEEFHVDLREAEFINTMNIQKEIVTETNILESSIPEDTISEDTLIFNNYREVNVNYISKSGECHSKQITSQNSPTEISIETSDSILEKMKDALKKIGTEIIAADSDKKVEPEKIVQDLEICAIPNEKTSLDILATVASKVPRQDLLAPKRKRKGTKKGKKNQNMYKQKSTVRKSSQPIKIITEYEQKCKPHDFVIVSNTEISPPANNIYTQKLPDVSITSEDSNDSEGNLLIDEDVDIKNNKHPKTIIEENRITEDDVIQTEKLSLYDEDTFEEEITFACESRVKGTVLISIPDNYQTNFDILKQIEEVELCSSSSLTNINLDEENIRNEHENIGYNTIPCVKDDLSATNETTNPTEKLETNNSSNEVATNADILKEIEKPTLEPLVSEKSNLEINSYKPFRTMAERKGYDKLKLNPYVSIERLNVCCKVKDEEKYIRTRSKSFDIGIIRNSERTYSDVRVQQEIYFEKSAISTPSTNPEPKICVEANVDNVPDRSKNSVEIQSQVIDNVPDRSKNSVEIQFQVMAQSSIHPDDNLMLTTLKPNLVTEYPTEEQIHESTLDNVPLLLRTPTKIKRRRKKIYSSKKVKQGKGKAVRQKVEKRKTENENDKSTKHKIGKDDVPEANEGSNIMTRLRRKTTLHNPEDVVCSHVTSDDTASEIDCKPRTETDSKTFTPPMTNDVSLNLEKKDSLVLKLKIEHEQTNLNTYEDELTLFNKTPKKPDKNINKNEEDTVGNSNRKYYTTPKLRRKSISRDNLNRIEINSVDVVSEDSLNSNATTDEKKQPFSADKKYYTAPKLRRKRAVKNESLVTKDTPKKITLKQFKPSTYKVDILSKSKNPVSPTIEKLKKKLEIDFKLSCDEVIFDKSNNLDQLSAKNAENAISVQRADKECNDQLTGDDIITTSRSKQYKRNRSKSLPKIEDESTTTATNQKNEKNAVSNDDKVSEENIRYDLIHFDKDYMNDQNVINEEVVEHAEMLDEQPLKILLKTNLVRPITNPKYKEIESNDIKVTEKISDVTELENILSGDSQEIDTEISKSKDMLDISKKSTMECVPLGHSVRNQKSQVVLEDDLESISSEINIKQKSPEMVNSLILDTSAIDKEIRVKKSTKQIENNENLNSPKVESENLSDKVQVEPPKFDQTYQSTSNADGREVKELVNQQDDSNGLDNVPLLERALKFVDLQDSVNKPEKRVKAGSNKKSRKRSVTVDMETKVQKEEEKREVDTNVENKTHKEDASSNKLSSEKVQNEDKFDKIVNSTEKSSQHFKNKKVDKQNSPITSTPNKQKVADMNNSNKKIQKSDAKCSEGIQETVTESSSANKNKNTFAEEYKKDENITIDDGRKKKKHIDTNKKPIKDNYSKDVKEEKKTSNTCKKIKETRKSNMDKPQTPLTETKSTSASSTLENECQNVSTSESHPITLTISLVKKHSSISTPSSTSSNSKKVNDSRRKEHYTKSSEKTNNDKNKTYDKSKSSSSRPSSTSSKDIRHEHKKEKDRSRNHKSKSRSSSVSSRSSSKPATPDSELSDQYEKHKHNKSKYRSSSVSSSSSSKRATPDILEKERQEHRNRERSKSKHGHSKSSKSSSRISRSSEVNRTSSSGRSTKKDSDDTKLADLRSSNISEKLDDSSKKPEIKLVLKVGNIENFETRSKTSKEDKTRKNKKEERKRRKSKTYSKQDDISPAKRRKTADSDINTTENATGDSKINSDRKTSKPKIKQTEPSKTEENLNSPTQCTSEKLNGSNQINNSVAEIRDCNNISMENEHNLTTHREPIKKVVIKLKPDLAKAKDSQEFAIAVEPLLNEKVQQDSELLNVGNANDAILQKSPELETNSKVNKEEEITENKTNSVVVKDVEMNNESVSKLKQNLEADGTVEISQENLLSKPDILNKISDTKLLEKIECGNLNSKLLMVEDGNNTNAAKSPKFNEKLVALNTNDPLQMSDDNLQNVMEPTRLKETVKEFIKSESLHTDVNQKIFTLELNSKKIMNPQETQFDDIQLNNDELHQVEVEHPKDMSKDCTNMELSNTNKLNDKNAEKPSELKQISEEIEKKIIPVNTVCLSVENGSKASEEKCLELATAEPLNVGMNEVDSKLEQNLEKIKNSEIAEVNDFNDSCDNLPKVLEVTNSEVAKAYKTSASLSFVEANSKNDENSSVVDGGSEKIGEHKIVQENAICVDDNLDKTADLMCVEDAADILTSSEPSKVNESSAEQASQLKQDSKEIEKDAQANAIYLDNDNLSKVSEVKCLEDTANDVPNSKLTSQFQQNLEEIEKYKDIQTNAVHLDNDNLSKMSEVKCLENTANDVSYSELASQLKQNSKEIEKYKDIQTNAAHLDNDNLSKVSEVKCLEDTANDVSISKLASQLKQRSEEIEKYEGVQTNIVHLDNDNLSKVSEEKYLDTASEAEVNEKNTEQTSKLKQISEDIQNCQLSKVNNDLSVNDGVSQDLETNNSIEIIKDHAKLESLNVVDDNKPFEQTNSKSDQNSESKAIENDKFAHESSLGIVDGSLSEVSQAKSSEETSKDLTNLELLHIEELNETNSEKHICDVQEKNTEIVANNAILQVNETVCEDISGENLETADLNKVPTDCATKLENNNSKLEYVFTNNHKANETAKLENEEIIIQKDESQEIKQIPDNDMRQNKDDECIMAQSSKPKYENKAAKDIPEKIVAQLQEDMESTRLAKDETSDSGNDIVTTREKHVREKREMSSFNVAETTDPEINQSKLEKDVFLNSNTAVKSAKLKNEKIIKQNEEPHDIKQIPDYDIQQNEEHPCIVATSSKPKCKNKEKNIPAETIAQLREVTGPVRQEIAAPECDKVQTQEKQLQKAREGLTSNVAENKQNKDIITVPLLNSAETPTSKYIPDVKRKKVYGREVKLKNIEDAFEQYLPTKPKENEETEEGTSKVNTLAKVQDKPTCVSENKNQLMSKKRKSNVLDLKHVSVTKANISVPDISNKKARLTEINNDASCGTQLNSKKPPTQISSLCISPKKKDRKRIEVIISHLKEEKSGNSVSNVDDTKNEVKSSPVDIISVNKLRSKLLQKIKYPDEHPIPPFKDIQQSRRNSVEECLKHIPENMEITKVVSGGSAFSISQGESDKTHLNMQDSPKNISDFPKESEPIVEVGGDSIHYLSKKVNTITGTTRVEYNIEIDNKSEVSIPENDSKILVPQAENNVKPTTTPKELNLNENSILTEQSNAFINDSSPGKHDMRGFEKEVIIENSLNDVIESSFIDNSLHIPPIENNVIGSLDPSTSREGPNLLNLSDLIMHVDSTSTNVSNMEEIAVSPEAVCMYPGIMSTPINSTENKLPCSSSPRSLKLFTFPVTSEVDIKEEFVPLNDVSKNSNFLDTDTSRGKVGSLHESCVFSFNDQIDNPNARTLSSPGLALNLQDVPFSNIPIGSTQSFDLISPKSLSMVQSSRNNNFTNEVPVGNEISDIMTEIICSNEPDDHNYTLGPVGGPLVSGRLEQENKNISPTTFNKPLDDSPNEFSLNDTQLQEFEFSDDTYKLNLDNEYAVKNLVILGSQTTTDTNAFPLTNYNVADIKRMNLIDYSISNSEENTSSKEYLDSIISSIKQETQSMPNDANSWAEFIANENPNQKVVVLSNEQCITMTESEFIESIRNDIVENGDETVKADKTVETAIPISTSVAETCLSQETFKVEPPKVIASTSTNKAYPTRNRKNVSNEPAQKDNNLNDFISKRRYSRTLLRPKKKNSPASSIKEPKKEATVVRTASISEVGTSNLVLNEMTSQAKSLMETNITATSTKKSTSEDDTCLLELNKFIPTPAKILKEPNDTAFKIRPTIDLIVPQFENKRKSPSQSHLSPARDIVDKQIVKTNQNQTISCLSKDLSEKANLQQKSFERRKSPRGLHEDLLQPTFTNIVKVTENLDISKASGNLQKDPPVPSIAELVKSRKRTTTNKYPNNYLVPTPPATRETNVKTETVKPTKPTSLDKPRLEEGVFNNTGNETRSKIDLFQPVQEYKKASPQRHLQNQKSPVRGTLATITKPFAELEGKGQSSCQTRSNIQKNIQDTLDSADNLTKSIDHLMKYDLLPKKPIIPPTTPAEPPKTTSSKYNYSIDSILSKDTKSFANNYKYENPVKDYRQPKNRGTKRSSSIAEDEKETGKIDNKKQRKLDSNGAHQPSNSRDATFDELLQQGNVNRLISLRVTEDNKLKPERRSSPLLAERRSSPLSTERRNSPLSTERRNSPLSTERKNSPLSTERRNSPLSTERKNSPLSTERKNSPLSTEKKNSPLLLSHNKAQNEREDSKLRSVTRSSPLTTKPYTNNKETNEREGINLRLESNPLISTSYNKEQNQRDSNNSRSSIHPVYDRPGDIRRDKNEMQEKRPTSRRPHHHPFQPPYLFTKSKARETLIETHRVQDVYNSGHIMNSGRETRHPAYYRGREGHQFDHSRGREGLRSDHSRGREGLSTDLHRGRESLLAEHSRGRGQQTDRSRRTEVRPQIRRIAEGQRFEYPSTSAHSINMTQQSTSRSSNMSGLYFMNPIGGNQNVDPAERAAYEATGPYTKRGTKMTPEEKQALIQSCQVKILDSLRPAEEDKDEGEYSWIDKFTERLPSDSYLLGTSASTPQFFPKPSP